jgi:hypothetical protein
MRQLAQARRESRPRRWDDVMGIGEMVAIERRAADADNPSRGVTTQP